VDKCISRKRIAQRGHRAVKRGWMGEARPTNRRFRYRESANPATGGWQPRQAAKAGRT
jgi:hypothetical protein